MNDSTALTDISYTEKRDSLRAQMERIPFFVDYDSFAKKITLRNADHIPPELFKFSDDIEILDASNGTISSLPSTFPLLRKVRVVLLSNHHFTEVPRVLSLCPKLTVVAFKSCKITHFSEHSLPSSVRWLILTGNQLETLPSFLGTLPLQKVALVGNHLRTLPSEMRRCFNLELIRIGANNFNEPPSWLFSLPRLKWYGDAGNPFNRGWGKEEETVPEIHWSTIDIDSSRPIGGSPSSTVFRGTLDDKRNVAVKIFENEIVTSDGYPESDMRATLTAGRHPNIVFLLGKLVGAPQNKKGLVTDLVPASYQDLALPPNFDTITGDVFPKETRFPFVVAHKILCGVAEAHSHLHKRNLANGDLYAHNVKSKLARVDVPCEDNYPPGHSILLDFGAASFYQPGDVRYETLDVRAYGHFMANILVRTDVSQHEESYFTLTLLKKFCLSADVGGPTFEQVCDILPSCC